MARVMQVREVTLDQQPATIVELLNGDTAKYVAVDPFFPLTEGSHHNDLYTMRVGPESNAPRGIVYKNVRHDGKYTVCDEALPLSSEAALRHPFKK